MRHGRLDGEARNLIRWDFWQEYEEALAALVQERAEADKAIAISEAEQALWTATNDKARKVRL